MYTNTIVISVHINTESYTYTHQIKVQCRNRKTLIWDAVGYSAAVRSTIFHPFPHRIILIIERKMGQLVNEITFFTHRWAGDLLKSQTKVVVDIDKLVKFLVRQPIENLCMQQGKKYSSSARIHGMNNIVKQASW